MRRDGATPPGARLPARHDPTPEDEAAPDFPEVKARSDAVIKALDTTKLTYWAQRAQSEPDPARKVVWLRRLAQPLTEAAAGHVPCRDGCSHCCNIPVLLSHTEAAVIASETGRPMARDVPYSLDRNDAYTGTPCPFLEGSRCGIYAVRPIACRTHYSAEADGSLCNVKDSIKTVRYVNTKGFDIAYVLAFGPDEVQRYADIRDFFPERPAA